MPSCPDPVLDRPPEEFVDRDAVAAYQQAALRLEGSRERLHSAMRLRRTSALDLDRGQAASRFHHEIHLMVTIAPVVHRAGARCRRVGQMRADRRFGEPTPELAFSLCV